MILLSHTRLLQNDIENVLNNDLNYLKIWAYKWLVSFTLKKPQVLFISNSNDPIAIALRFNKTELNFVESHKHLGISFSKDAKCIKHIDEVYLLTTKKVSTLRKLKFILNRKVLNIIYISFILLCLEYACEVWDRCTLGDASTE